MSSRYGRGADAFMPAQTNYIDPVTGNDIAGLFGILNAYTTKMQHDEETATKAGKNNITINNVPDTQRAPVQIMTSRDSAAPVMSKRMMFYIFIIFVAAIIVANSAVTIVDLMLRTIGRELRDYLLLGRT